jgi:hypothetical protein
MDKQITLRSHVEISSLDLRYESFRLKSRKIENSLLASIINQGIQEPLKGIDVGEQIHILLDGFKRYRCAKKLNIRIVPYHSFGSDEPLGVIRLIRMSNAKPLTILEQARMIEELQNIHSMTIADIAGLLEKSKAWVSMRTGLFKQMSQYVMKRIFDGDFPAYSFMYTLRRFIRMNTISKTDIDDFVKAVAGKGLSIRDIELLAAGFFKGSEDLRQQIKQGDIAWGLSKLKESASRTSECTPAEQKMLKDLETVQRYMQKITYRINGDKLNNEAFHAQAGLLVQEIINMMDMFRLAMERLYDRCKQA